MMPSVELKDLADRIMPQLKQCPADIIAQQLIDVIRDFCNVTRGYVFETDGDTILLGQSDYTIELPGAEVQPVSIEEMKVDDAPCYVKTTSWFKQYLGANWRTRDADDFRYFTQLTPAQFTFPCQPTKNGTVNGIWYRVSLRPRLDALLVDEALADEWLDTWTPGALWKLKCMADKPWTDAAGAALKLKEWVHMRGAARIHIAKAYGYTEDRWANPGGFA